MFLFLTAHFFQILAKHGLKWTGVTSAYILALLFDAGLFAFLIYCLTI